jgi:hypothetical protein
MIEGAFNFMFSQHSHEMLAISIAFYVCMLLLINAETMKAGN